MKLTKIATLLLIITLFSSCYEEKETSRVSFYIGNNIPAGITKIHVAVYFAEVAPEKVVLSQSFNPGTIATLNVPKGNGYIFVVVGENTNGLAEYSGVSGPYSIDDTELSVGVSMNYICDEWNATPPDLGTLTTDNIGMLHYLDQEHNVGADQYTIYEAPNHLVDPWTFFFQGKSTRLNVTEMRDGFDYKFQPYFTPFNLYSNWRWVNL